MEKDYVDKKLDAKIIEIGNQENIYEVGYVSSVQDFIIEVTGLENVMFYEKINIADKAIGYVNKINNDSVTVAVLKIDKPINVSDIVYSTNTLYQGSYSPSSLGRIVDLFGEDKLTSKTFSDVVDIPIERKTIPIMDRTAVNRPLFTGITGIDLLYPIGRGQRQLIIGDKKTGKTQICLDTIVNQKDQNMICIYVAIGKTKKEVKTIYSELAKRGALDYTVIITAFNDELPPVISLIPYFSLSVAENYMMEGKDVLVVIDDLKRHAEAYREISLISGKTPGRDAYPADIFYTHSRLLEKGCQHKNGASISILPIVETKGEDITDYISTNIISITDGQIVLSSKNFQKGEKPAIDYGLSVSRLGGAVQYDSVKKVGAVVRRKLLSFLETRSVYELVNLDEMSAELKNQFMEGKIILDSLKQYKFSPKNVEEMIELFKDFDEDNQSTNVNEKTEKEVYVPKTMVPDVIANSVATDQVSANGQIANENNYPQISVENSEIVPENIPTVVENNVSDIPVVDSPVNVENNQAGVVEDNVVDAPIMNIPLDGENNQVGVVEDNVVDVPIMNIPIDDENNQVGVVEDNVVDVPIMNIPLDGENNQVGVVEDNVVDVPIMNIPIDDENNQVGVVEDNIVDVPIMNIPIEDENSQVDVVENPDSQASIDEEEVI